MQFELQIPSASTIVVHSISFIFESSSASVCSSMAESVLGLDRKALCLLGLFSILLLIEEVNGYQFNVGGPRGSWEVPKDPNSASFNTWAESSRFQIGDSLLFVYPADKDSVLQVKKDDYTNCNTATPLEKFSDGHTVFTFNQSGPHYFISGNADNCKKNEKIVVIVMADRSNHSSNSKQTLAPPPFASAEVPPSPAPAGEESPSPPPAADINPALAPSEEAHPPPPSSASKICSTVVGFIGAFVGSSLLVFLS